MLDCSRQSGRAGKGHRVKIHKEGVNNREERQSHTPEGQDLTEHGEYDSTEFQNKAGNTD